MYTQQRAFACIFVSVRYCFFMSFLEAADFCSIEEYATGRSSRMKESELETDGLYTYMMRLSHHEKQAAKQAVRIEEIVRQSGGVAVKFAFLDESLLPELSVTEGMQNGFILLKKDAVFVEYDTNNIFSINEAYLRDYFEEQFGEFLSQSSELQRVI